MKSSGQNMYDIELTKKLKRKNKNKTENSSDIVSSESMDIPSTERKLKQSNNTEEDEESEESEESSEQNSH